MAKIAQTDRVSVRYVQEDEWSVTPENPTFKEFRVVSESLKATKAIEESAVQRDDRQVEDQAMAGLDAEGALNTELTSQSEDFIAAALQNTWNVHALKAANLTGAVDLSLADQKITFANAADYAKIAGANWIRISGSATETSNDGRKKVVARDGQALTVTLAAGSIKADETSGSNVDLSYLCRIGCNWRARPKKRILGCIIQLCLLFCFPLTLAQ